MQLSSARAPTVLSNQQELSKQTEKTNADGRKAERPIFELSRMSRMMSSERARARQRRKMKKAAWAHGLDIHSIPLLLTLLHTSTPTMARGSKRTTKVKKDPTKRRKSEELDSSGSHRSNAVIRPTAEECIYATVSLAKLHPHVVDKNEERRKTLLESCGLRDSITDSVISTMLSQNTTDKNSKQAWKQLKEAFPDWGGVCDPNSLGKVEAAIKVAGLAKTRAERMHKMLVQVREERGVPSLDYLRDLSDEEVKRELSRFKGLGPKTISCVLLFAMGRPEFPVDTHVLRISQKLGWVPSSATREGAYDHLNATVPPEVKLDLHCLLVTHGKHCHACAANGKPQFPPKDGTKLECPLAKSTMASNMQAVVAAATKNATAAVKLESDSGSASKRGKVRVKMEGDGGADIEQPDKKKPHKVVVKKEE